MFSISYGFSFLPFPFLFPLTRPFGIYTLQVNTPIILIEPPFVLIIILPCHRCIYTLHAHPYTRTRVHIHCCINNCNFSLPKVLAIDVIVATQTLGRHRIGPPLSVLPRLLAHSTHHKRCTADIFNMLHKRTQNSAQNGCFSV